MTGCGGNGNGRSPRKPPAADSTIYDADDFYVSGTIWYYFTAEKLLNIVYTFLDLTGMIPAGSTEPQYYIAAYSRRLAFSTPQKCCQQGQE